MTAKGWLVSGVAAVASLFAAGVVLVLLADRGAAGTRPRPATVPAGGPSLEAAPRAAPQVPSPVQAPAPAAPQPPAQAPAAPATPAELPSSMEDRVRALEPLRLEVLKGLGEQDGRIDACRLRGVELVVTLESLDRRVRILDVAPRGADGSSEVSGGVAPPPPDEAAVRCVRGALGQTVFDAPSAAKGRQWQMSYVAGARP